MNEEGKRVFPPTPTIPAGNDATEKEQNLALRHAENPTANAALAPAVFPSISSSAGKSAGNSN